ncbi:MAG TPA: flavodoxin-dependent (E)-4-hydroxy-3-methylbut-2-enyl-diphosphate synthase, partial [Chryseosolibacter sp.]|nr:flavodoxin-dependent (E)-4-hydroxy-3-methylbut-2-enyl-diphosphate synthase [Chryseosolibacter sp.]
EEPEAEVPVAIALVNRYADRPGHDPIPPIQNYPIDPFSYTRRATKEVLNMGGHQVPRVIADFSAKEKVTAASLFAVGYNYSVALDKWNITDMACDYVYLGDKAIDFAIPGTLGLICNYNTWLAQKNKDRVYPLLTPADFMEAKPLSPKANFILVYAGDITPAFLSRLKDEPTAVLVITTNNAHGMAELRRMFTDLINTACRTPVITSRSYRNIPTESLQLLSATDIGGLFIDGLGDGIFLRAENCGGDKMVNETAFNILQATRTRISKTEYISCPSCGRTLFDLQETTAKIRSRTFHLKGIKIGIMGCIVNGPGEMADADYGYVGSGPGRITLYKGKEVVKRNVPSARAVDELIEIIRSDGNWIEPPLVA